MGQAKVIELRPSKEKEHKPLTENQAREATAKCYRALENAQVRLADLYFGHADTAMGYDSWDEYCKGEFNGIWLKLPREKRRDQAKAMVDLGMSRRAVASALGVDPQTVLNDLKKVDQAVENSTPRSTTDQAPVPDSGTPNGPVPAPSEPVTAPTAKPGMTTPATAKGTYKGLQVGATAPPKTVPAKAATAKINTPLVGNIQKGRALLKKAVKEQGETDNAIIGTYIMLLKTYRKEISETIKQLEEGRS